jgi:hypothetical protein
MDQFFNSGQANAAKEKEAREKTINLDFMLPTAVKSQRV